MRAGVEVEIGNRGLLTAREAETLLWIAAGKTSWEAARIMGVSEATATAHVKSAMAKLNAATRPHLVTRAFLAGILRAGTVLLLVLAIALRVPVGVGGKSTVYRFRVRRREDEVAQICALVENQRYRPA